MENENFTEERIPNTNAVIVTENIPREELDVLNRNEFINNIITCMEFYSNQETNNSISYAINGRWGIGKTWILNKLIRELNIRDDINISGGRYLVFNYNAWEYDYYEEPLVSLLICLDEQIQNNKCIIKDSSKREKCADVSSVMKDEIIDLLSDVISISSLNPVIISAMLLFKFKFKKIKKQLDELEEKRNKSKRFYNPFFDINNLMKKVIKSLNKLTSDPDHQRTIVLFVDELDRCRPEYAIKVLERMHHLTTHITNLQIIYSIDNNQLEETIRTVYGQKVSTKDYLAKFIKFGFTIPENQQLNSNILIKQKELLGLFDYIHCKEYDITKLISRFMYTTECRIQENLFNKILFVNQIINSENQKLDYSILAIELFIGIANLHNFIWDNNRFEEDVKIAQCGKGFKNIKIYNRDISDENNKEVNRILFAMCEPYPITTIKMYNDELVKQIVFNGSTEEELNSLFFYYLARLLNISEYFQSNPQNTGYLDTDLEYIKKFKKLYETLSV